LTKKRKNRTRIPMVTTFPRVTNSSNREDANRSRYIPKKKNTSSQKADRNRTNVPARVGSGEYTGSASHPQSKRAQYHIKLAHANATASMATRNLSSVFLFTYLCTVKGAYSTGRKSRFYLSGSQAVQQTLLVWHCSLELRVR
jgi:hypothetical protein